MKWRVNEGTDAFLRPAGAGSGAAPKAGPTILLGLVALVLMANAAPAALPLKRWVYQPGNFLVDAEVTANIAALERFASEGYNGVVVTDYKFMRWDSMPAGYTANIKRFREATRRLKMEVVASVMPLGYSNGLLNRDPNLAEGLPVERAPFVVRNGRLVPEDDGPALRNGGFEQSYANKPDGWSFTDDPGRMTFVDTAIKHEGRASFRMQDVLVHEPKARHARACQPLTVKPFRYYHVSVWVRTQGWDGGDTRVTAIGDNDSSLCYQTPALSPTQDWKRVDIAFNTLENTRVNLYLGTWNGRHGTIWWDDVRLEPAGFINVLRRPGTPLTITSEDGTTTYEEGRDFGAVRDPKLGTDPWAGEYTAWHEPPVVTIPEGSRLKEGQRVLAAYYHTAIIYNNQVPCCLSEPKVYEILEWEAQHVRDALAPDAYMMSHDEIRIQGWDKSCADRHLTGGEILADNARRCVDILHKVDPGKPIWVWSDMFDPNHNAQQTGRYYLVKGDGPWFGSWKGLPAEVGVLNWNMEPQTRRASMEHFAGLGHHQILAGYYDDKPAAIADWLKAGEGLQGVDGVMYTTWRNDYHATKAFLDAASGGR